MTSGAKTKNIRFALMNVLFASFGYVAIRFIISPVRIKLLTSLLDKEEYALLTLVMLTISFITLIASLGSLEYILRKIPGRDASFQYSTLRTVITYFGLIAAVIGIAGALILMFAIPDASLLARSDLAACAIILVVTVHLTQLVYFLMGRSKYAESRMLMLLYADAWFLPLFGLMWFLPIDISFMLWLWTIWLLLSLVVAQRLVPLRDVMRQPLPRGRMREILLFGVPLLPVILGEWIFQLQDRYVLLAKTDLTALANYTLCFNIAWVGITTGVSVIDVLITEFFKARNRIASNDIAALYADETLRRTFTMMLRYGLLISVAIGIALWIGRLPMVLLLSNAKFADAADIMAWVAPLPVLYLLVVICGRIFMATDRGAWVGMSTLIAAGLHLIFNLTLTPMLAERGTALAGCLAYGLLALYLGLKSKIWRWIIWSDFRPFRFMIFMGITAAGLSLSIRLMPGQNLLPLVIGGAVSVGAMFLLGLVRASDIKHIAESMNKPHESDEAQHL